jgi:hypothetical protein
MYPVYVFVAVGSVYEQLLRDRKRFSEFKENRRLAVR